jgi:NADPH:quinone reductase-like Zn-dependent oxidoreductase
MRAIRQETLGGPEVLELVDLPTPEPAPTEVLVRVHAAGVNPVDWKTRARGAFLREPPFVVGWDVAGIVEQVGAGVTRFVGGDRVFGMPRFPREAACYAEYVTSPSRQLARTPDALSDVEAAALPLAGLTAWQAVVETANVRPGDRVLVLGAAGGVGHLAVQIAKARGASVIGTASAGKHPFLAELGADEAVDYTTVAVEEAVSDVDTAIDVVGSEETGRAVACVRDGGLFIAVTSAGGVDPLREAAGHRIRVTPLLVEPDRAGLEELAALVEDGTLRPHVSATFPLEEAARAHEAGETGRTQGKLVLTIG